MNILPLPLAGCNLKWNQNGTVTYENAREYHYNPNESNGTLDDMLTIVNAPAGSISYTAKYQMTAIILKLQHTQILPLLLPQYSQNNHNSTENKGIMVLCLP